MDPTRQRRLTTTQRQRDKLLFTVATKLIPATAALGTMLGLHLLGTENQTAVLAGGILFWAAAFEAVTTYRSELIVPRHIDLSLDADDAEYYAVVLARAALAGSAMVMVVGVAAAAKTFFGLACGVTADGVALLLWAAVAVREIQSEETHGRPRLVGGTLGNRLKPARWMRRAARRLFGAASLAIEWGSVPLAIGELLKNFLIIGSVGSGKTLIFKRWVESLLPNVAKFPRWRALIVDPKSEFYPWLLTLLPSYKIKILNPGDARSFVWRIHDDLTADKHIHEASYLFIPQNEKESQPFFTDGARGLLCGVMLSLRLQAPNNWWFSDIFYIIRSQKRLRTILSLHPEPRDILFTYGKNDRLLTDVHSTLDTKIKALIPVAKNWSHVQRDAPHRTVSLKEWVAGNFLLLVGKQASSETAESALIALLLKRATQLLLDGPTGQSTQDPATSIRTLIAVEEAPRAGKLDIINLVTNGRDYGVGICVATQSIEAILAHYQQPSEWDAVASEFHSGALLHTNSPTTARWMSERVGRLEEIRRRANGQTDSSWIPTLEPTEFQMLGQGKTIGPDCVPGVFLNSRLGVWYSEEGVSLNPPLPGVPARVPIEDRSFRPWDEEDLRRLNLLEYRDQLDLEIGPGGGTQPGRVPPSQPQQSPRPKAHTPRFRT